MAIEDVVTRKGQALAAALQLGKSLTAQALISEARIIEDYLEGKTPETVTADPPSPARKPRASKTSAATTATATSEVTAAATPIVSVEAAPSPEPESAPQSSTKSVELTLDDVRAALVDCATRKGTRDVPLKILGKYAPSGTTGSLPKENYKDVIAECKAA